MFERIMQTFSAMGSIGFEHPFRFIIAAIVILIIVLVSRRTFVTFNDAEQRRAFERSVWLRRILIVASRSIVILLICAVFAGPFVTFPELVNSEPKAVIVYDRTASMENVDSSQVPTLIEQLESRVSTQSYSLESSSWDAVRSYVREGTPILLASDGMLSGDGLAFARYARALNASVNIVALEPIEADLGIDLQAPPLSAAGVEVPLSVRVDGNALASNLSYRVLITLDDQLVYNVSGTGPRTFDLAVRPEVGEKTIVARLDIEDAFVANDVSARTMVVSDRPTVHLVTQERGSALEQVLSRLYALQVSSTMPSLDEVSALIIDDLPARELDPHIDRLSDFVLDGGGLVVLGGERSYDRGGYRGSRIESLLPVTAAKSLPGSPGRLSVALIIDVSSSTGDTFANGSLVSIEDVEKSLAVSVYEDLKQDDNVGVIAFNRDPRVIQELTPKNSQGDVIDRIRRLNFAGGTFIDSGLGEAARMLARSEGTRYAILFSDGRTQSERADMTAATALRNAGITLYTVSVGESSDSRHLQQLARVTGGSMFAPGEEDRFEILFGTNEQRPEDEEDPVIGIVPWDENHFVSTGLSLDSRLRGFNNVVPKRTAQLLVVGTGNQPIVASAFFGLGRIVSIATDNGGAWAGEIYEKDTQLISRSINYALGDAAKQQEFYVRARDPREGDVIELLIFSRSSLPATISIGPENVSLTEIDEGEYRGTVALDSGIYRVGPRSMSVNYASEYVYPDTSMVSVASAASGKRFDPADISGIEAQIVAESYESSNRMRSIASYFLLVAAIIFLIEVAVRRLTERRSA